MKKVLLLCIGICSIFMQVSAQDISVPSLQKLVFDLQDTRLKALTLDIREQEELLVQFQEFYTERTGAEKVENLKSLASDQLEDLGKPFLQGYKLDVKINEESIKDTEDGIVFEAEVTSTQVTNDFDTETKEQVISEGTEVITYVINNSKELKISKETPNYILEMSGEGSSGKSGDMSDDYSETPNGSKIEWLPYNANTAVNYAYLYWNSPNSNYCNYANISGGDCTNFVSQCMKVGGWATVTTSPPTGTYVQWYYNSCYNKSTSWAGARYFNDFLRLNPGNARVSTKFSFLLVPNNAGSNTTFKNKVATLNKGAILQQGSSATQYTSIGHSMIITKTTGTNRYVTYRSVGSAQMKDKLVTDVYSGTYLFGYNVNP